MLGQQHTAPAVAVRLAERAQFIKEHPGWTFRDYDEAAAGDIAFQLDFETMQREAQRQAIADAQTQGAK